jgi:hypothetical protein
MHRPPCCSSSSRPASGSPWLSRWPSAKPTWTGRLWRWVGRAGSPQTVVQPLFLVAEMVGPALVGLYVFGEREALDRLEQLYFAVGLVGGILVALSFSGGV